MDNVKITKRDKFEMIKTMCAYVDVDGIDTDMIIDFCNAEIAAMDKRAMQSRERAAEKRAADTLIDAVYAALNDEFATRAEITERVGGDDVTVAKVGYRLTSLVKDGKAVKDEATVVGEDGKNKRVSVYKLA